MADYRTLLITLDQWGLRDLLLPFAIIFTLCFAILQKLAIFKTGGKDAATQNKPNKKVNTILSLAIAAASLTPHFTGRGFDVVIFINTFLPNSFLLLFVVLLFLALIGTVSEVSGKKPSTHPLMGMLAILSVVSLIVIILQSTQQINYPFLNFLNDPNTQAIAIVILVFVLIIWYINKPSAEPTKPADYLKKFGERMQEWFEGK